MRPVESLETRRLLASFTASSVAELIADINAANAAGGFNTITLEAGATFTLNVVNNVTETGGPTGLPVIAAGNDLTILGNGGTVERSSANGTPAFRLFAVEAGGSLALNNLTLSRGLSVDPGLGDPQGGAVSSDGTLSLNGVTVQNCAAQGGFPSGGAIYSSGVLTVANSVIQNNQALGGTGDVGPNSTTPGGSARGGGICLVGGSATLTDSALSSNVARGGDGGKGGKFYFFRMQYFLPGGPAGSGSGGAIYASNTAVHITRTSITQNAATGGVGGGSPKGLPAGAHGTGRGGGVYVAASAVVSLDPITQLNTRSNTASTSDDDIFGSFTILA